MLALAGIAVLAVGFALRLNPLLVVVLAAIATGVAVGRDPVEMIAAYGKAFNDNRYVSLIWLMLPVIGLLERSGLQERAQQVVGDMRGATVGRLLFVYFVARQLTAALGLLSLGGQAQMVRPLLAPMVEAAAETRFGRLPNRTRDYLRAHAAATDNVAVFFGEDIFIAVASILLIKGFLAQNGIDIAPFELSVWALPTAAAALLIHGARLFWLDRKLKRDATEEVA